MEIFPQVATALLSGAGRHYLPLVRIRTAPFYAVFEPVAQPPQFNLKEKKK
jgi:hypothetical protein